MGELVTFDPFTNNVVDLSNNDKSLGGNFNDSTWRGALMAVGITDEEIAEWEIHIDAEVKIGVGISAEYSRPEYSIGSAHIIGLSGRSGTRYLRGIERRFDSRLRMNDTVKLRLDMTKGELSIHVNHIYKGVLASNLKGRTWWPYCGFSNLNPYSGVLGGATEYACSLKSFKFVYQHEPVPESSTRH
eukprot:TRINITY_DN1876_c0_g1_i1.p1 TRINITY_DN1876_c0_g1~~TRINITY_DN1876_c0_g1_i1.p1  ORF type:complete len:187 (-),score=34.92 TRINITY_DN1876_c0_g1_i1:6-566(-)